MDDVQLIVDVERNFNIEFSNGDLETTQTVGEFYDVVLAKARQQGGNLGGGCASAHVFYRLRRGLVNINPALSESFRAKASLCKIIPRENRRRVWNELSYQSNLKLPKLVRPGWIDSSVFFFGVAAFCLLILAMLGKNGVLVFYGLGAWGTAYILHRATLPLAIYFPQHAQTVGGLVRAVIGLNFHKLQLEGVGFHRGDVWQGVRSLVAEAAGVRETDIAADTNFVRDLCID